MTPKEKAKELVKKFGGKLNAIKCVDEIIKVTKDCHWTKTDYWQEVKQEIEKL